MYEIMLMRNAKGWFTGYNSNVPGHEEGKVRATFVYNGGTPKYVAAINDVTTKGYEGIVFSGEVAGGALKPGRRALERQRLTLPQAVGRSRQGRSSRSAADKRRTHMLARSQRTLHRAGGVPLYSDLARSATASPHGCALSVAPLVGVAVAQHHARAGELHRKSLHPRFLVIETCAQRVAHRLAAA